MKPVDARSCLLQWSFRLNTRWNDLRVALNTLGRLMDTVVSR